MSEEILTIKEDVLKLRNSKNRYLKIPENQFEEVSHGDVAEVARKETEDSLYLIYKFNKKEVKKLRGK